MEKNVGVTVRHDGSFDVWPIPDCPHRLLNFLKEQVGGYLEVVPLRDSLALVLNADGKMNQEPANLIASNIAYESEAIVPSDYIAGAAVVIPMCHL